LRDAANFLKATIWGVCFVLSLVTDARAATDGARKIQFLFDDARVYVPVRIAGQAPQWFILDTGATRTIIDTAVARSAGIDVRTLHVVRGAGSGESRQGDAPAVRLDVGGVPLQVAAPAIMDLASLLGPTSGRAPAGIIGSQFFREHYVELDFAKRVLSVQPPGAGASAEFVAAVPLSFVADTPLARLGLTLPSGRTIAVHALVDLGAKSTLLLPEPFIERDKLRAAFPRTVTTGFGAGVGGNTSYAFARSRRMFFADAPALGVDRPVVGLSVEGSLRSTWYDALLGAEFLARFKVGFDYAGQRLLLTPQLDTEPPFDRSGLFLVAEGPGLNDIVVRQVLEGSPAEVAGLAPGDSILALDATPVAALSLGEIRNRLKAEAPATVTISYRRNGKDRVVRLTKRELL